MRVRSWTRLVAAVLTAMILCGLRADAFAAPPTDNPVAAYYGAAAYPWTDGLNWSSVFNILDYGGDNSGAGDNVAAFNAARDAANAAGGGVVYCPAGTYNFADGIQLKDGVVIRGDTPGGVTSAKTPGYSPPTRFEFPQYVPTFVGDGTPNDTAFKSISSADPKVDSNIGLVNLDINRASIGFGSGDLTARNRNIVVFGVRSNNVARPDPNIPRLDKGQEPWQRFSYRFANNVAVQPWRNTLIANNRLNDETSDTYLQPNYKLEGGVNLPGTLADGFCLFNYTDHYGIVVGRGGGPNAAFPEQAPARFRPGITVRDNYVKTSMRVKIHAGGYQLEVLDNICADDDTVPILGGTEKVNWVHPAGYGLMGNSNTLENRGIDVVGWDVICDGNGVEVYRHRAKDTGYFSVDGEGILYQEHSGTGVNGLQIAGNTLNCYVGLYKMSTMRDVLIQGNDVNDGSHTGGDIYVNADTNYGTFPMFNVVVDDNETDGHIRATASITGTGNLVTDNTCTGSGTITYSDHVTLSGNAGYGLSSSSSSPGNDGPEFVQIANLVFLGEYLEGNLGIECTAIDGEGIAKVEFYNQDALIATDLSGADGWSCTFPVTVGEYMFIAKAYDDHPTDPLAFSSDPMYVIVVPEPVSLSLMGVGLIGIALRKRLKRTA